MRCCCQCRTVVCIRCDVATYVVCPWELQALYDESCKAELQYCRPLRSVGVFFKLD